MPQRVIHPTNRTPANSSLANFKVQQASRIKRSIFATLSDHRHKIQQSLQKMNDRRDDGAIYPYAYEASTLGQKDHTHTKSEPKSNATTGNSSHKQDTRQLVTCEFQSSTSKPDKEVHFRYSRRNFGERPQTQNSATVRGTKNEQ